MATWLKVSDFYQDFVSIGKKLTFERQEVKI
jgi:hypothetical protein